MNEKSAEMARRLWSKWLGAVGGGRECRWMHLLKMDQVIVGLVVSIISCSFP